MPLQQSFANGSCCITFAVWRYTALRQPSGIRQYLELERALRLFVGKEFFVVLINPFDGG